ncbi:hypothetical protein Goarm_021086 [Gossypium armourianum]|uniref:Uncharacterized protein n=1 Tax=Gossypium armourianum TaxID=34283 RepID=A0A7J9IQP4_9ROSI|nr:hypothetical protein [Gossypium armourianum]
MAASHQQGNDHLKFISNSPCFFKIILQDTIQNGKLGIPRKSVRNHGNSMSSPASSGSHLVQHGRWNLQNVVAKYGLKTVG